MAKKNTVTQIMAFLALFWIIASIIWTWLIIIFSWWNNNEQTITEEQFLDIQKLIETQSWAVIETNSWSIESLDLKIKTSTWETK